MSQPMDYSNSKSSAFETDIAVVNIFYGDATATGIQRSINFNLFVKQKSNIEYETSQRMSPVDFMASVGGLFGLCLGFSFISFVELFYWFIFKTVKKIGQERKETPF